MLKVEFVRYRNTLCATILEQGDEIKRDDFYFEDDNFVIKSRCSPYIDYTELGVRGCLKGEDYSSASYVYDTVDEAKEVLQGFKAAIEAYNASLLAEQQKPTASLLPEREQQATDMETVIVG